MFWWKVRERPDISRKVRWNTVKFSDRSKRRPWIPSSSTNTDLTVTWVVFQIGLELGAQKCLRVTSFKDLVKSQESIGDETPQLFFGIIEFFLLDMCLWLVITMYTIHTFFLYMKLYLFFATQLLTYLTTYLTLYTSFRLYCFTINMLDSPTWYLYVKGVVKIYKFVKILWYNPFDKQSSFISNTI